MSSDRAEAIAAARKNFEHFAARLSDTDLEDLNNGFRQLALLRVDGRLARLSQEPIEVAYEQLSPLTAADLKSLLTLDQPSGRAKPVWLNHVLTSVYGRTYSPPPAPRVSTRGRTTKANAYVDPREAAAALASMTSTDEGSKYLRKLRNTELVELVKELGLVAEGRPRKADLVLLILDGTIRGRGTHRHAQHG